MTKQEEIKMTEERLAKEEEALQSLLRYSKIQQTLPGPGEQILSTSKEIEHTQLEVQRLRDKLKLLRG